MGKSYVQQKMDRRKWTTSSLSIQRKFFLRDLLQDMYPSYVYPSFKNVYTYNCCILNAKTVDDVHKNKEKKKGSLRIDED